MMSDQISINKRIANNTIFLYIRMLITMLIALYTSRALLHILGVNDFGLYGLIGGVVTMFASLKTMFTVATQRFLNIEIGRKDDVELSKVFNVSILVNFAISIVFIIVAEIIGQWLINNKLNISENRVEAANWVFQLSVIASTITILNIPFDSIIIAREKMNVYATISIFDAIIRLGVIFLLPYFEIDKLVLYGIFILFATLLNLLINISYCQICFPESKIHYYPFKEMKTKFREMSSFSIWAFLGNVIFSAVHEGINILLNLFGSVVANAARSISVQVRIALGNIVSNVYVAVKPQAIQSYACYDIGRFYKLMFTGAKLVGYIYIIIAIPLFFTLNEFLHFWLGKVPEYAIVFLQANLLYQFVRNLHESVGMFFVTIGRIKEYQIVEFFVLGLALPISFVALKYFDMPLYGVFMIMTFTEVINLLSILLLAYKIGRFDIYLFFKAVISPYLVMTLSCFASVYLFKIILFYLFNNEIMIIIIFIVLSFFFQFFWLYRIGLTNEERNMCSKLIIRRYEKGSSTHIS